MVVTDKTMLIYVAERPLMGWPSGTGSASELPISLTTNFGRHGEAKMFSRTTFSRRPSGGINPVG